MSRDYNSQAFTPEEVKKGLHLDLINYLIDYNSKADGYFNDIHITTDGYCTLIEWVQESYKEACTGFEFVGCDEEVMKIVHFPDNSYGYASNEDEANDMIMLWIHENPDWKKDEYGHWYQKIENDKNIKEILD
jgi:hypothetical protein